MKWFRTIHSTCCGMTKIGFNDIWGNKDNDLFHSETGFYIKGSFDVEALEEYNDEIDEGYDIVLFADQLAKSRMVPLKSITAEMPSSSKLLDPSAFLDAYHDYKARNGKLDFTDMLTTYHEGDYPPGDVSVVFVDEAQDLSKLQWEIVNKFAADADELHLAGDDDQSIYKFLGADEYGFLDYPSDEDNVLTFSHRVPETIGLAASSVINQIERRKDKEVQWQDKPGTIERYALDEMFLPWKDWARGDESVMVLTRHRRQMYEVRKMLNRLKVPHTVKGTSMGTSQTGKLIRVYLELTHGITKFRPAVVAKLLEKLGDRQQASEVRALGVDDRKLLLGVDDVRITITDDWPKLFSKRRWEIRNIETLRREINEHGLEIVGPMPRIDISTYHGSKGREADHVVLFTDYYQQTWQEQERNPDSEIRLAYVGLTRAMKTVTIIVPRTSMYLRALV
jgi:superfamily I DNA/RNA helicase